jgi:hypothetical protein
LRDESAPTAAGPLRRVTATGNAVAVLPGEGESQEIGANRLVLSIDETGRVPQRLEADGNVTALADGQRVTAATLAADVAEIEGELQLVGLIAKTDVVIEATGEEPMRAEGQLLMSGGGVDPQWRLTGGDAGTIMVRRGADVLTAETATFRPSDESADLAGPGTLVSVMPMTQPDGTSRQVPVTIRWQNGASYEPAARRIDIRGPLTAEGQRSDGETITATAQNAEVRLGPPSAGDDLAADVEQVILRGEVDLGLVERDEHQALLRRMNLLAEEIRMSPTTQALLVPGAGRMLYEDRRPSPEGGIEPADAQQALGDFRGIAGMRWQGRLTYDDAGGLVVQDEVQVRAQPADGEGERFTLAADRVTGTVAGGEGQALQIAAGTAEGNVDFTAPDLQFRHGDIAYDAATGILTAVGRSGLPIRLTGAATASGTADRLAYNTITGELQLRNVAGGGGR